MTRVLQASGLRAKSDHMIGQTFGKLTVQVRAPNRGSRAYYECRCECGKTHIAAGTRLRSGHTKSCGCLRVDNMKQVATKHGNSEHPLYVRWSNMMARCYDPSHNRFYRYGARGIKVCKRWHQFDAYLEDVAPSFMRGLTLDRIDNDGDYEPTNIRWATYRVQARNRPACVVSEDDISAMRDMYASGGYSQREVGEAFGHPRDTVKHYLRGLRAR